MASGFGMAGDAADAAVVSKAILVGQTLEPERTGGTREVQIFFCFFWLFMGLTWFKMVYMSSIFLGGGSQSFTHLYSPYIMDKSPQADRIQKRSATPFPMSVRWSLRPTTISYNTTMTSALRGQRWPLVLELMAEMRRRQMEVT
jgi:hypothetical protein